MACFKEFRAMAGPGGRTAHRPSEPSTYEYESKLKAASPGASSSTV